MTKARDLADNAQNTKPKVIDAKGDLIVGTGADAASRLAVSDNGSIIVADSAATTGLRYQSAYNGNGVINGGLDIWQRGTSFALTTASTAYTADRWLGRHQGTNITYSQQSSGLTGIQYSLRIQRPNGVTGTNDQAVYYQFETADSYRFAGQTVTLSFWAKAGANFSPTNSVMASGIYSGTGTNQNITSGAYTGQVTVANQNNTLTTSWQRFSVSGSIGTTATQIAIIFSATPVGTAGANDWYEITGVQLELGSVATSFKKAGGGTLQGELACAQRYAINLNYNPAGKAVYNTICNGYANSTTKARLVVHLPAMLRAQPTSITYSGAFGLDNITAVNTITALTINQAGTQSILLEGTVASGLTSGQNLTLYANNDSNAYILLNAEL